MDLAEFLESPMRNAHIEEPGLRYYVRKPPWFKGAIELASCSAVNDGTVGAYWRFLKRYEHCIAFIAEQVLNDDLCALYERRGWRKRMIDICPQYASPLMVETFRDNSLFRAQYSIED